MAKKNNNSILVGVVILAIIVVAGAFLLNHGGLPGTYSTTTIAPGLTTTSVPSITTTIVKNQTTATAPNIASCAGYNYSTTAPNQNAVGSCGWNSRLMNVTVSGGPFITTTLTIVQLNVTYGAPYNQSISGATCASKSIVIAGMPIGNYRITFSTGTPSVSSTCAGGSASMRLGH